MFEAAVDCGGTRTKVVVASPEGERTFAFPSDGPATRQRISEALARADGVKPESLDRLVLTGGATAALGDAFPRGSVELVDEAAATARGGILSGAEPPAIIVSLGTGTGIVLAEPGGGGTRLLGSGVGGGTFLGLAELILGPRSIEEWGALAASGDAAACDLKVGDIVGGAAGDVPAEATAAHFGRLPDRAARNEADLVAGLLGLVVQNALRIALGELGRTGAQSVLLLGGLLAEPGLRRALEEGPLLQRFPVPIADDPAFAVARGALALARER